MRERSHLDSSGPAWADFYVAPNGNDAWSGRLPEPTGDRTDGPFGTLEGARDSLRELRTATGLQGDFTVAVRGGVYRRTHPFVLGPADSSLHGRTFYGAFPGERPVISGGREIRGWKRITETLWTAEIPEVEAGEWYFRQLFVNGTRRPRARLPREGLFHIAGPIEPKGGHSDANKSGFRFRPGDLQREWANLEDIEVVVLQFWMEARLRVLEIDEPNAVVRFTGPSWRSLAWNCGYYVENVREGLTAPGQWYLDRRTGVLTYRPLPGEDMQTADVIAPVAVELIRFEGEPRTEHLIEDVTLAGLAFEHTAWPLPEEGYAYSQAELHAPAAVWAEGAVHCRIAKCEFSHLGGWALDLGRGCRDNEVVASRFTDLGGGGIRVGEPVNRPDDADEARDNRITDNVLIDGCQVYLGAPAIWVGQSRGNRIAHNEVRGDWQWAISVGWNWQYLPPNRTRDTIIEFNDLHDLGTGTLGMHGAIYTLGLSPGTVIRNNLIRDVAGWPYHEGAGMGIILDNGCAGIVVENNVVCRAKWGGLGFNYNCLGNIIQNNIFAFGKCGQLNRYGDPCPGNERPPPNANFFIRNIIYWKEGKLYREDAWPNFDTISDLNLYWDTREGPVQFLTFSFDEWKAKGLDVNSVVADPGFEDPEGCDFRWRAGSPAERIGFKPIDLSMVGPRRTEDRVGVTF